MKNYLLALFVTCTLSAQTKQELSDIDAKIKEHSSNHLTIPQFSGKFFPLIPLTIPLVNTDQLVVKDIDTAWDIEKFKRPRIPAKIGEVENQTNFTKLGVPRCIHLPIKLPKSDIRIPQEYQQFTEVLQKILDYEYSAKLSLPIDLNSFDQRMPLPIEAVNFDPKQKNTLITISSDTEGNDSEELRKILDIRLYPSLRNLIREENLEVFLGSSLEMAAYYKKRGCKVLLQFKIPSSATYYLAEDSNGRKIAIMAGLVSRENLIAQLLTLKLAGIPLDSIEIIGEINHFAKLVEQDISLLRSSKDSSSVLIVAGCGFRDTVSQYIYEQYSDLLASSSTFDGNVVHLTSIPLRNPMNGISRFIVVDLVYGEIMEPIVEQLLDQFSCSHVFSGSAGGFIPFDEKEPLPEIGDWVPITKSMHYSGEIVSLTSENDVKMHLQIPSIFLETYEWLENARTQGASVDVETFYILRAINKHNQQSLHPVQAHCGYFVSDYLGKKPLRSYAKVYAQYPTVLSSFLAQVLNK